MQHERVHIPDEQPEVSQMPGSDPEAEPGRGRRWWIVGAALAVAVVLGVVLLGGGDPAVGAREVRPTPVRAALAVRGDLVVRRQLPGEVIGEAAALSSRVAGRVESVLVRPGDRVAEGQVVAVVDAAELVREHEEQGEQVRVLEANLRRAEARIDEAASQLRRGRELAADRLISEQELERLEAQAATVRAEGSAVEAQIEQAQARLARLGEQLAETRVRAPFAGIVADRFLDPGAVVQAGTPIVRLVQEGQLLVQFRAPERLLGSLVVGAPFTVTTHATGDHMLSGRIVRIAGEVARADRTALVEGELVDAGAILRPGMYADVSVQLEELTGALLVPGAAVVERLDAGEVVRGVFVAPGNERSSTAQWRTVRVLELEGETAAVAGALEAGERVLVLGHEQLADASAVLVVEGPGSAEPAAAAVEEGR